MTQNHHIMIHNFVSGRRMSVNTVIDVAYEIYEIHGNDDI
jgi:hypothetical protein